MRYGQVEHWSGIAMAVVAHVPADEAIPFLLEASARCELGHAANILQALGKSGAPEAHKIHRAYLERLWKHPDLFKREKHLNCFAADAVYCIEHLLKLGEPAVDFREKFEALCNHPNEADMARNLLGKYFGVTSEAGPESATKLLSKYFK
jgi:hypothetical protein